MLEHKFFCNLGYFWNFFPKFQNLFPFFRNIVFSIALILSGALLLGCDQVFPDDLSDARQALRKGDALLAEKYLKRYLQTAKEPTLRWEAWKEFLTLEQYIGSDSEWIIEALETMLLEYENDAERTAKILSRLGESYEKAGNFHKAIEYWMRYVALPNIDPEHSAQARQRLAFLYRRTRNFNDAEMTLKACLDLPISDTMRATCLYTLADNALTLDLFDESRKYAEQLLSMNNVDPVLKSRTSFILADIQEQQGKLKEALATFQAIRNTYPNPLAVDVRIDSLKKRTK